MSSLEEKERQYLDEIKEFDKESVCFYSNRFKPLRERKTVKAFLRVCGVSFRDDEVKSCHQEPPDVVFREARFEVVELLDEDRARHKEYKQKAQKSKAEKSLKDLMEPYTGCEPMEIPELSNVIEKDQTIDEKIESYKRRSIDVGSIDLLIYLSLKNRHVKPSDQIAWPRKLLSKLEGHGWRSVSFIMGLCAGVIFCKESIPDFMKNLKGRLIFAEDAQIASSLWED